MKIKSIISMLAGVAMLFSLSSCFDLEETVYNKMIEIGRASCRERV